jgi:hypothetical protein
MFTEQYQLYFNNAQLPWIVVDAASNQLGPGVLMSLLFGAPDRNSNDNKGNRNIVTMGHFIGILLDLFGILRVSIFLLKS